jgi:hypothetical protein
VPAVTSLTVAEIAEHAARLTYRPGWRFDVYAGRYEGAHIAIHADLPDAENVGQTVRVRIDSNLPPFVDVEQFEAWLLWRLGIIEMHEAREWFRRDGRMISDPRAPDAQHDL